MGFKVTKRDWTPRRYGAIYCSPACGANCTHAAYLAAHAGAKALCKLLGPAWKPKVWENMAWYWAAECDGLSVTPPRSNGDKYMALFNDPHTPSLLQSIVLHGKDPRRLVQQAVQRLHKAAQKANAYALRMYRRHS